MHTFTDNQGQDWNVSINLATAKRLRTHNIDLLNIESINKVLGDVINLFDLLYLICETQAKERGVDEEQFGSRLAGVGAKAVDTLIEEIQGFFTEIGREKLAAMVRAADQATKMEQTAGAEKFSGEGISKKIQILVTQDLQAAELRLDQEIQKSTQKMEQLAGVTSTDTPVSSD